MQLRAEQLAASLERQGLSPIYCISGDEPLQMLESADMVRGHARDNGYGERTVLVVDKGFEWNRLWEAAANLSLFSDKRLIELRLGANKPGREGGAALVEYAANPAPGNLLLITSNRIDKKAQQSKWYKALERAGTAIQIWPVEPARLPAWLIERTKRYGKQISRDAARLIADKVEGNMLAARQELEKLCLLVEGPEIELADAMASVADSARFDVFALVENALTGNMERVVRMLRGLKNEGTEPMGIFGALMWEFRRLCSMAHAIDTGASREKVFAEYRIWQQRKPAVSAILNRMNGAQLASMLRLAATVDKCLKGAIRADGWEMLENFLLRIGGVRVELFPGESYLVKREA